MNYSMKPNFQAGCCLVVNYQMPGMNELKLVARLRDRGLAMPAILVINHSNENLRKRAAVAGLAIVKKPVLGDRFIECIRRVFE
jgi:two-component system response regulator FixJ